MGGGGGAMATGWGPVNTTHSFTKPSTSLFVCVCKSVCGNGDRVGACKYHTQLHNTMYISLCLCECVCVCVGGGGGNGDRVEVCKYHAQLHNTMYILLSLSTCARACVW